MQKSRQVKELILLDTHIWIWLVNGDRRVSSSKFLNLINRMAESSGIRVSVISVWEVGMLESKGKISLPYSCLEWVQRALRSPGISLVPLTPEIAIESSRLPGTFHGDSADRILIATARDLGASLVTEDGYILAYSRENSIHTISPKF